MNTTSDRFGVDDIPGLEYKFCVEAKMALLAAIGKMSSEE